MTNAAMANTTPHRATNQVRARHQPENGQSTRAHDPAVAARTRRRVYPV